MDLIKRLKTPIGYPANLLLNTGPLPNGKIHPEDVKALREVGKKIKREGWDAVLNS